VTGGGAAVASMVNELKLRGLPLQSFRVVPLDHCRA
jgi:hypothetical protein